jgi:hypothetical protein
MTVASDFDPIFVHASPRSGSTYFFNVLRRNESLLCFNEAIMDGKRDYGRLKKTEERDLLRVEAQKWDVNHHFLEREDFEEFIDAWDSVMHLCPEFPSFHDYLPPNGVLSKDLSAYLAGLMSYARSQNKRPVLCEINSRGRAGALRGAFGGYHIAQYRDPFSQFGSFVRALVEGQAWGFLSTPLTELGTSAGHPLYRLIPEAWRVPNLPWRTASRAQFWASCARYIAATASLRPETVENLFAWHMFSWVLNNLVAVSYSDMALDIDKVHDDANYRASVIGDLTREIGVAPDFSDIKKYDRYYEFESFDATAVCDQIVSTIKSALADGRLDAALRSLGTQPPLVPAETAVELLLTKIHGSLASMANSTHRHRVSVAEWKAIAEKNQRIWFNPSILRLAEYIYPVAAPVVWAARRAGISI